MLVNVWMWMDQCAAMHTSALWSKMKKRNQLVFELSWHMVVCQCIGKCFSWWAMKNLLCWRSWSALATYKQASERASVPSHIRGSVYICVCLAFCKHYTVDAHKTIRIFLIDAKRLFNRSNEKRKKKDEKKTEINLHEKVPCIPSFPPISCDGILNGRFAKWKLQKSKHIRSLIILCHMDDVQLYGLV